MNGCSSLNKITTGATIYQVKILKKVFDDLVSYPVLFLKF